MMIVLLLTFGFAMEPMESRFAHPIALPVMAAEPGDRVSSSPAEIARLRELYFAAVKSSEALLVAEKAIERRLAALPASGPATERDAVVLSYAGALRTLRAKHGNWPPSRLRDLQDGLRTMDAMVELYPAVAEIRYLRLMSCYYLPSILGRTGSVREDFRALARLLPAARESFSAELYEAAAAFVLDHGGLPAVERVPLERSLAR
jgi:hypothetical protein